MYTACPKYKCARSILVLSKLNKPYKISRLKKISEIGTNLVVLYGNASLLFSESIKAAIQQKAIYKEERMKIKEIIIKDYEEIIAELREVFSQMNTWCLLGEDYLMY